jgi:hypothetical protein
VARCPGTGKDYIDRNSESPVTTRRRAGRRVRQISAAALREIGLIGVDFEDFEEKLRSLSRQTRLPLNTIPVVLGDIAGVLMQEARMTLFEDREEVSFDAGSVREELLRMGHDGRELGVKEVRLLLDFFMDQMVDPRLSRN